MNTKKWMAMLLSGALALCLLAGCGGETPPAASPEASPEVSPAETADPALGDAAALGSMAAFTAGSLDGGEFTQDDIAAKDMTVVNFWSVTCRPCVAEMPDLAAFERVLPDNVQLITVCLDAGEGGQDARPILEDAGYGGVTLISGDGDLAALCYNIMAVPTTVFVDSGGRLVGDAMVGGGHKDLSAVYLAALNDALEAVGKDAVSLEEG